MMSLCPIENPNTIRLKQVGLKPLTQSFLFFYSSSKESSLRCLYWSNAINPAIGARMAIACSVVETTSLTISKEAIALYVSIPR